MFPVPIVYDSPVKNGNFSFVSLPPHLLSINRMMVTRQAAATYITQFLTGFNIVMAPEEKGAEKYVKVESFTWDVFIRVVDHLLNNRTSDLDLIIPSVSTKKVSLIQKVKIDLGDFQRFLNNEQRDPRLNEILHPPVSKGQARELMERLEGGKVLTARGLLDYLMSEENNVLDLASLDQYMDMNKPLNHYFVNSSHNTYLNGWL
ncbi:1-phosphatidylinositol 4,5-bisphosphate phosphodiesterase beta-3 [Geodia barretti]|uniref:1-phosphatidylinositol 4,5-bisphosphate phosphodiesterase beta-3 n=1 Tax=Geodia barretti TaxID=519541 RepID=A0AA35SIC9_GEOBA|nr:1-phosphatidylinositol 4,5-bisphosphate phosphodiesterase beta-3 [Geodia barretti]